jgi:hypothetical protein
MTSQIGNDIPRRFSGQGFLVIFKSYSVSIMYRSEVMGVPSFAVVNNGELAISATRMRLRPEVASSVDGVTTVSQ